MADKWYVCDGSRAWDCPRECKEPMLSRIKTSVAAGCSWFKDATGLREIADVHTNSTGTQVQLF